MEPVDVGIEPPATWGKAIFGQGQPEYLPLPALIHPDGRVVSRWTFTPEERAVIAAGADVFATVHTFGSGLQPLLPTVGGAYVDEWRALHPAAPAPPQVRPVDPPLLGEELDERPPADQAAAAGAIKMVLESTDEVALAPTPAAARVWQGFTEDGAAVTALITLAAVPTGDPAYDERLRRALETRIPSQAVVIIPVAEEPLIALATEMPR